MTTQSDHAANLRCLAESDRFSGWHRSLLAAAAAALEAQAPPTVAGDETPEGPRVDPPGETGPAQASQGATPIPALLPCPFCGGAAELASAVGRRRSDGEVGRAHFVACARCDASGPAALEPAPAALAWNKLPRLADGLRPESASTGFALLDEAARHALEDTAEGVLWLRRAVTTLAERHGVKLPPAPRIKPRRPT